MTDEQREWFSSLWKEFVEHQDRDPNSLEWSNEVWLELEESRDGPISSETRETKERLIEAAFRELQIPDSMRTEIERKLRDGNANFYNRSYNDGSF